MAVYGHRTFRIDAKYFNRNRLLETPFILKRISLHTLELISKFLHFAENSKKDQSVGDYNVFNVCSLVKYLHKIFQNICTFKTIKLNVTFQGNIKKERNNKK